MPSQEIFIVVWIVVYVFFKKTEAVYFMDGRFVVIFNTCIWCHSSLILKSVIKPMDLLYFAFQFYLNLRLAAFVSHFLNLSHLMQTW